MNEMDARWHLDLKKRRSQGQYRRVKTDGVGIRVLGGDKVSHKRYLRIFFRYIVQIERSIQCSRYSSAVKVQMILLARV